MCRSEEDVQTAIKFCNDSSIDFVVKSGGRNQASTSIKPNALVLDLTPLKQIAYSLGPASMSLRIQAGASFRELEQYLAEANLKHSVGYTVSLGWDRRISCVGAHTIMGNGLAHRQCGLGVDLVKSARVLLSSGEIVTASE
jgi:FAD/FMN-containing dehydrogenase